MMDTLPEEVRLLFCAAIAAGYRLRVGKQQMVLFLPSDNQRIGGWNTRNKHWYISVPKTVGRDSVLKKHGFTRKEHPQTGHRWWQRDGVDGVDAFQRVVQNLTDVPITGVEFRRG